MADTLDGLAARLMRNQNAMASFAPETLILFARFPEIGKVKTRLIPALGAEVAAREHRLMVEHTLTQARAWRAAAGGNLSLAGPAGQPAGWRRWLGNDFDYAAQTGRNLGQSILQAVKRALRRGARRVVVIGSDCPALSPAHIQKAFRVLEKKDLVLGPAADGGYYLIGLKKAAARLFSQVAWGTGSVFAQTKKNARTLGWTVAEMDCLSDVDCPRDLKHWSRIRTREAGAGLSVIIPAWNEAATIAAVVSRARQARQAEVLVVDGGSTDATQALAKSAGARVLRTPRGRALQLRAGAARARSRSLLFLHADTLLPEGYDIHVREILSRPGVALGAFTLRVASVEKRFRWVEAWVGVRARVLGWPYGDQALFLTRETYQAVQGFPDRPILEDVGLVERARTRGRVAVSLAPVVTSARRWLQWGVVKTFLVHQAVWLGYWSGLSLDRLARWYRRI